MSDVLNVSYCSECKHFTSARIFVGDVCADCYGDWLEKNGVFRNGAILMSRDIPEGKRLHEFFVKWHADCPNHQNSHGSAMMLFASKAEAKVLLHSVFGEFCYEDSYSQRIFLDHIWRELLYRDSNRFKHPERQQETLLIEFADNYNPDTPSKAFRSMTFTHAYFSPAIRKIMGLMQAAGSAAMPAEIYQKALEGSI